MALGVVVAFSACWGEISEFREGDRVSRDGGTGHDAGGQGEDAGPDGGEADSGVTDPGDSDAGLLDAGPDGDAGRNDAGLSDAGMNDAGLDDAGVDASVIDAGTLRDGGLDAGSGDAGHRDSGIEDAGNWVAAVDCSPLAVANALDAGVRRFGVPPGFTLRIPAGTCDWGQTSVSVPAGVHLKGAGRDATRLYRSISGNNDALLSLDCWVNFPTDISGITLRGLGDGMSFGRGLELAYGCRDFRVFDSRFERFGGSGIDITNNTSNGRLNKGVLYNNEFLENFKVGYGYGISVIGDGNWHPFSPGSLEAVYVEGNLFRGNRHSIASNAGSIYVFRHNTINDNHPNYAAVDAHGRSLPPSHGSRGWEIYRNTFNQATTGFSAIGVRGGEGVIFENTMATFNYYVNLLVEDSQSCSTLTYPVQDQPTNVFIWGNTPSTVSTGAPYDCSHLLALNRDYFLMPRPGYTPAQYPHPGRLP